MVDREDVDFRVIRMLALRWVLLCFALEIAIEMGKRIGMESLNGVYMIIMV